MVHEDLNCRAVSKPSNLRSDPGFLRGDWRRTGLEAWKSGMKVPLLYPLDRQD
jgi:hypothetical protein